MNKVKVSAPGKIILTGEHAVVYDKPSVLSAIDLRLFLRLERSKKARDEIISPVSDDLIKYGIDKLKKHHGIDFPVKIEVDSKIPIGCGFGSSAALSSALSAAFLKFSKNPWNLKVINKMAYDIEKKQHGNPSGADNTVSTYGGFIRYQKGARERFSHLDVKQNLPLCVINTGKPDESTREMVELVKSLFYKAPRRVASVFKKIEVVSNQFLNLLFKKGDASLSDLIKENELLLEKLGVVSPSVIKLIREIEQIGGAAKITGAGGAKDKSGMILTYHPNPAIIKDFAKKEGLSIFFVKLGREGVREENN